jgi:outer membrane protein OmpA-like peptidoglycan-associated protein
VKPVQAAHLPPETGYDSNMTRSSVSILFALVASTTVAHANVEIGGTAGIHIFDSDNELGVADQPAGPSQRNSLLVGFRIGVYFLQVLGIEAEMGMIPTVARETEFGVTDLTYRAQLVAQLRARDPEAHVLPFLFVGAGAFTVVDSNNVNYVRDPMRNISQDTDAAYYFGLGLKLRGGDDWGLRADARVLAVPSSENSLPADPNSRKVTADFEALLSIYADIDIDTQGARARKGIPTGNEDPDRDSIRGALDLCPEEREDPDGFHDDDGCPEPDNDGDGILDCSDKCTFDAEDRDGFEDRDGCPERDNDGDGVSDSSDRCPGEAEDKDSFTDDDGCPDPDNDLDGISDVGDACDGQAETINGYNDTDGCPDEIPTKVAALIAQPIRGISFKVNSGELLPVSSSILDGIVGALGEVPDLLLEIQVHTDDQPIRSKTFATNLELSQARADTVRAYFIAKGIDGSRILAKGYGEAVPLENPAGLRGRALTSARAKNRRVELRAR